MLTMVGVPDRSEAPEYYFKYIDRVPDPDVCRVLAIQRDETCQLLGSISEDESLHRYAPDKWTIREVLGHINDTERLVTFRAWWFARGFHSGLPSFDQNVAAAAAGAAQRTWDSHVQEFLAIRGSTILFFTELPAEAWLRRGIASDHPFTVRALAYIAAGHVIHHAAILRERYLNCR
jgi:DinB family protein